MKIYDFSSSGKVRKVIKMNKKTWEKVRKVMKINEENSEKNLGKFDEKWGKLWR